MHKECAAIFSLRKNFRYDIFDKFHFQINTVKYLLNAIVLNLNDLDLNMKPGIPLRWSNGANERNKNHGKCLFGKHISQWYGIFTSFFTDFDEIQKQKEHSVKCNVRAASF